jgi:maleylpyruvate isomerase
MRAELVLHDYWRSGAGYRVRIGLNFKGLAYERRSIDLRTGAQGDQAYRALAPQGLVPALVRGEQVLTQSLAILEWLEETYPKPRLLPRDPMERALVRSMALLVAADIHPLGNLRVLNALRQGHAADEPQVQAWIARWIGDGFAALERLIERHGGGFAFGDAPTLADCCLAPQVYAAERFKVDLAPYPRLMAAYAQAAALDAFAAAHPDRQSDAA